MNTSLTTNLHTDHGIRLFGSSRLENNWGCKTNGSLGHDEGHGMQMPNSAVFTSQSDGPSIFSGTTHWSNCSGVTTPRETAASWTTQSNKETRIKNTLGRWIVWPGKLQKNNPLRIDIEMYTHNEVTYAVDCFEFVNTTSATLLWSAEDAAMANPFLIVNEGRAAMSLK